MRFLNLLNSYRARACSMAKLKFQSAVPSNHSGSVCWNDSFMCVVKLGDKVATLASDFVCLQRIAYA